MTVNLNVANNAQTTLVNPITAEATSFVVEDVSLFPEPPFRVTIDAEIMEVGAVNPATNTFSNVTRGLEDTTPAIHNAGVYVENRFTAGSYDALKQAINEYTAEDVLEKLKTVDGPGSGLDADTVDGKHAGDFMNAVSTGNPDPNTTEDSYIRTNHANSPGLDLYWHILTFFYSVKNNRRAQFAVSYNGSNTRAFVRHHTGSSWTAWNELISASGGTMTGALVAQNNTQYTTKQVRNIILSPNDPSGGANGDVWVKYTP